MSDLTSLESATWANPDEAWAVVADTGMGSGNGEPIGYAATEEEAITRALAFEQRHMASCSVWYMTRVER